jgi:hypothetical protein
VAEKGDSMKKIRDLSETQLRAKLEKLGFKPNGFMGYYSLPSPCAAISISKFNAGSNRRAQLAYLVREFNKYKKDGP